MNLKSLEISGFKSFAKKAVLEFNCPITAIVGPNGSGKSNVAEAFRFVLGEQSIKSMRGKRGEDLIFNGGKSLGRLNRASVKVTFDNRQRELAIDFDEVTIERSVHRDSANEYFINNSSVRLKDIIELLAGAHIGASGHHIISQGEADKILNANLKERREMIEDALGLKIYHYKRLESQRKLEKTKENIKQVESLRREIAPHIKFLQKQVEKVEKAREMRVELEQLYKEYFKREYLFINYEKNLLASDRLVPEAKYKQLEEQLTAAKEVLAQSEKKDHKSEELLGLESKLHTVRDEKDKLVREIGRLEGQIVSEKRMLKKQLEINQSHEDRMVRLSDVESITKELSQQIDDVQATEDVTMLKAVLWGIRSMFQNFITRNKSLPTVSVTQDSELEIVRLEAEIKQVIESLEAIQATDIELNARYAALQLEIEKEKDSNRDAEKLVFKLMAEQNEVISDLALLRNRDERIKSFEADSVRELQEAAVLVGRAVLDFDTSRILSNQGWEIPIQEIVTEPRTEQESRRKTIERIKVRLEDAGGGSGEEVVKEFDEAQARDEFLRREIADLQQSALTLELLVKDLEEKLTAEFKTGVEKINNQFQDFFALMFGGGSASLQVIREERKKKNSDTDISFDEENLDTSINKNSSEGLNSVLGDSLGEEGIDISVHLPQKKIKSLMMLSGGERALTSIALLFAISQVNPPPFIILDETDAALDEANSRKYGEMITNLSKYSELILITHNRETMSRAGVLYGVTMGSEGFSKLLSIQFDEAVQVAK